MIGSGCILRSESSRVNVSIRGVSMATGEDLAGAYKRWLNELALRCPEFLGDTYSNPYYAFEPDDWEVGKPRVLVVGEEGFGLGGHGKEDGLEPHDIPSLQEISKQYMYEQVYLSRTEGGCSNRSAFWRRIRKMAAEDISISWTNIDKIHHRRAKGCALTAEERSRLHSLQNRILASEIDILRPAVLVFFGWYGISLQHELPEVFSGLYPAGLGDTSRWFQNVVPIEQSGRTYLFTYHPSWGSRQKDYEEKVLAAFRHAIEK